jgi:hypothetical protein
VQPPSDDRPFFGHFFKWAQAREIWAEMGKTWQPFGGAGYFVILALLAFAILGALALVLLPVIFIRRERLQNLSWRPLLPLLAYFACIGLAFMLVEIPLIQRFILYLGNPAYAITAILFSLLFFSGIGSRFSSRFPPGRMLAILAVTLLVMPVLLSRAIDLTLGLPFGLRLLLTALFLAPVGFLMGIPFPSGIHLLGKVDPSAGSPWIGWAWATNGAASVVASILAALLAISTGFTFVFYAGALLYAAAWLALVRAQKASVG